MQENPSGKLSLQDLEDNGEHICVHLPRISADYPPGTNWTWSDYDRDTWEDVADVHDGYRKFYQNWRDSASRPSEFTNTSPYKLSLGEYPPPFLPHDTSENQILVTESYEGLCGMYHRILDLRNCGRTSGRGVVLTGQPGTGMPMTKSPPRTAPYRRIHTAGKSAFLKFMLVRLISACQVVVLCHTTLTPGYSTTTECTFGRRCPASRAFQNTSSIGIFLYGR